MTIIYNQYADQLVIYFIEEEEKQPLVRFQITIEKYDTMISVKEKPYPKSLWLEDKYNDVNNLSQKTKRDIIQRIME